MQIVDNKVLLFRTRHPEKYALIPKHRVLSGSTTGIYEIAVKWGIEEVKVLRNLGVKNVPSPIQGNYEWPGRYKPFQHQLVTSSFLTMHNRAYVFNEAGCVDSETEYLSETGWVKISEYAGGKVAQYSLSGRVEFVLPEEYVKIPCEEMIRIKTKYGIDQLLSPEHRVLAHSLAKKDKTSVMSAAYILAAQEDFANKIKRENLRKTGSDTISFGHIGIPAAFFWGGGKGISLSDEELRVQIAVIADGHFGSATDWCVVRIKKDRKIKRLAELLTSARIDFVRTADTSETGKGFEVFKFHAPWKLKKFDSRFWDCSAEQLRVVRDEIFHWDGSDRGENKGNQFFSTEKESADFVQFAFASAGIVARITKDVRENRNTCYVVTVRTKDRFLSLGNRTEKTVYPSVSTDGFKYCFRVPSTFLIFRRNGCVFASGNTGKSASCLWAADYLMKLGHVRRALIICPLSIMEAAWMRDIMNVVIHRTAAIAHASSMERRREIVREGTDFVIVNYDGVIGIANEVRAGCFDLLIVDECNFIKNSSTNRWKAIAAIVGPDTKIWALTGTPAPQSPMDAYGLAKLVTPGTVPKFVTAWRDKTMLKVSQFKWVAKGEAPNIVHRALQPAIRYTKEMCLDLPPILTTSRIVPLTPMQEKYYKLIKARAVTEIAGETITAVNAATVLNKLLQISAGAAYTDERETITFDCKPRLSALREILADTDKKVIVFAAYRHSIDTIVEDLKDHNITTRAITGDVSAKARGDIFNAFQNKPDPRVLVIQPQAASHGVTLTAADTVVFWGPVMSVETYLQCIARAHRIGQVGNNVTVVHLQGSEIEAKMFRQLAERVEDHFSIVKLYDDEMKDVK